MKIVLNSLDIAPELYFLGTDQEIEQAERKEQERRDEIANIIFSPDFQYCYYMTDGGQAHVLHHSTRQGVKYQLSFIGADGVPTMHESYIKTGVTASHEAIHTKAELLQHFVNRTLNKDIILNIA